MPDNIAESTSQLLRRLRPTDLETPTTREEEWDTHVKLFAKTQYLFYVSFQTLVLGLALAVATALVISIIRVLDGVDVTELILLIGSIATGIAAAFLQKQASEAHTRYKEAQTVLKPA
jgi:hypothetical protein